MLTKCSLLPVASRRAPRLRFRITYTGADAWRWDYSVAIGSMDDREYNALQAKVSDRSALVQQGVHLFTNPKVRHVPASAQKIYIRSEWL